MCDPHIPGLWPQNLTLDFLQPSATMTTSSSRNGFWYYQPQTVNPSIEHIFEFVTLFFLVMLLLIYFLVLRYLKRRHPPKENIKSDVVEEHNVYCAMNYAPLMEKRAEVVFLSTTDNTGGTGRPGLKKSQGRVLSLFSRLRSREAKKAETDPQSTMSRNAAYFKHRKEPLSRKVVLEGQADDTSKQHAIKTELLDEEKRSSARKEDMFGGWLGAANVDERATEVLKMVPYINEHGQWENVEIQQTSVFQVNPYTWRNALHGTSGPFLFERRNINGEGYDSDATDDDESSWYHLESSHVPDFGTLLWEELPSDARLAAEALGINQAMWCAQTKSEVFMKYWDELTVLEQAACVELGFNKTSWDQRFDFDDFQLPTYEGYEWKSLPQNARLAAETLGYSQQMWDSNQDPELCRKKWRELTKEQQAASLALLGFDHRSWDCNWLTDKVQREEIVFPTYENHSWDDLPPNALNAALTLGYDKILWDSHQDSEICKKKWKKLDQNQKLAAFELYGFDQRRWDNQVKYQGQSLLNIYVWEQLPSDAKDAAEVLGYTAEKWDENPRPVLSTFEWDRMMENERAAWFKLILSIKAQKERMCASELPTINSGQEGNKYKTDENVACKLIDFDKQKTSLLGLILPAIFANIGQPLLRAIITVIVLTNMGTYSYFTWMMMNLFLNMCDLISAGVVEAQDFLVRQAVAAKKFFLAAQYAQLSVVTTFIFVLPFYVVSIFLSGNFLRSLGFGDVVADYAILYAPLAAFCRLVQGCVVCGLDRLMWCEGRGAAMILLDLAAKSLQVFVMVVVIVGFNFTSMECLGLIEVAVALLYMALIYNICDSYGWLQKYDKGLLGEWSVSNKKWAKGFLKASIPLHIGHILSCADWLLWIWFAVAMGPAEAAAWTIMQILISVLQAFSMAVTNAAEIQIGISLGSGRIYAAREIAKQSLWYLFAMSVSTALGFYFVGGAIIRLFTNDQILSRMIEKLLTLASVGSVVKAIGCHSHMILQSIGRARTGVVSFYIGTYLFSLPLAIVMVLCAKFGLESLMMACVIGYSIIAFTNLLAVERTDWILMGRKVMVKAARNEKAMRHNATSGELSKPLYAELC